MPKKSRVTEVPIASDYLIHLNLDQASFSDNFRLVSDRLDYRPEPKDLMIAFFLSFPASFRVLLHTREAIAKKLGLKTAPESDEDSKLEKLYQFKGEIGESVAIFEVLDKNENELLTGQTDSHLDFKLSFLSFEEDGHVRMELATTVVIHNTLGKIYFGVVRPFHKFYLKRILTKMERELLRKSW